MRLPKGIICSAPLCNIPFAIYATDFGGSFDCETRIMYIPFAKDSWPYTLSVLLHEATECAYAVKDMRFANPSHYRSHDSFVFQFDHHKFSDATQCVADFVANVYDSVHKAWEKVHKQTK